MSRNSTPALNVCEPRIQEMLSAIEYVVVMKCMKLGWEASKPAPETVIQAGTSSRPVSLRFRSTRLKPTRSSFRIVGVIDQVSCTTALLKRSGNIRGIVGAKVGTE